MKLLCALLLLISSVALAQKAEDLINFKNEDTLHGNFVGFTSTGKIIWKYPAAEQNIGLDPTSIRRIALNKTNFSQPSQYRSSIMLSNGDHIFGEIISFDDKELTLQTDFAGLLKFRRQHIASVFFADDANKLYYRGPFDDTAWDISEPFDNQANAIAQWKKAEKEEDKDGSESSGDTGTTWRHKNFCWIAGTRSAVRLKTEIKGNYRIMLKVKGSPRYLNMMLCAGSKEGQLNKNVQNRSGYGVAEKVLALFGECLSIRLDPRNNSQISCYTIKENGHSHYHTMRSTSPSQYRNNNQSVNYFEIRVNRDTGIIYTYNNGHFMSEWKIKNILTKLNGNDIGFWSNAPSTSGNLQVSDISVIAWNGITDSAASLNTKSRDIALLANGTDRISSSKSSYQGGTLTVESNYGTLNIPRAELESLSFATQHRKAFTSPASSITFLGGGKFSGTLARGEGGMMRFEHALTGTITIDPKYIATIDFVDILSPYAISEDE